MSDILSDESLMLDIQWAELQIENLRNKAVDQIDHMQGWREYAQKCECEIIHLKHELQDIGANADISAEINIRIQQMSARKNDAILQEQHCKAQAERYTKDANDIDEWRNTLLNKNNRKR